MKGFSLAIGISTYKIKFRKKVVIQGQTEVYGFCDFENKVIAVSTDQSPDMVLTTLTHEFAHALLYELGEVEMAHVEHVVENFSQNIARLVRALPKGLL